MNPNLNLIPRGVLAVRAEGGTMDPRVPPKIVEALDAYQDQVRALRAEVDERLNEIEQRTVDGFTAMPGAAASGASPGAALAAQLIKSDVWAGVAGKRSTKGSIDVASSMLLQPQANTIRYDTDQFDVTERLPGIVTSPMRRTWLRQRFPTVAVTGGDVEYHRLLTYTNNAAPQGGGSPFEHEGVAKAESSMTFEAQSRKISTIAHFIKASKQILSDVGMLGQTIDTQLRHGLELEIEDQLITGDGTGANMSGLTDSGNYTAFTPTSGDTALDSLSRAKAAIASADGAADLIVLHPNDWAAIERLKADTAGTFLLGNPAASTAPNVWGVPVHVTPAMTQGKFLCLATMAAVIFDRQSASVVVGWVDDDFTKNLVTILAEGRLTIGVQQPSLVRYGDLTL